MLRNQTELRIHHLKPQWIVIRLRTDSTRIHRRCHSANRNIVRIKFMTTSRALVPRSVESLRRVQVSIAESGEVDIQGYYTMYSSTSHLPWRTHIPSLLTCAVLPSLKNKVARAILVSLGEEGLSSVYGLCSWWYLPGEAVADEGAIGL